MVPKGGFEPPRVAPHAPQTCVSASSTTSARCVTAADYILTSPPAVNAPAPSVFGREFARMAHAKETSVPDDEQDEFELPPLVIPKRDGPECPFCGEPMQNADGDYLCIECNGGTYGPETG